MNLNELAKEIHEQAKAAGWYDKPRSALEVYALIHSEISEAVEEVRKGTEPVYKANGKYEGEMIELADTIIRILDYCAFKKWNIEEAVKNKMEYNKTRPYRHGGKLY